MPGTNARRMEVEARPRWRDVILIVSCNKVDESVCAVNKTGAPQQQLGRVKLTI